MQKGVSIVQRVLFLAKQDAFISITNSNLDVPSFCHSTEKAIPALKEKQQIFDTVLVCNRR